MHAVRTRRPTGGAAHHHRNGHQQLPPKASASSTSKAPAQAIIAAEAAIWQIIPQRIGLEVSYHLASYLHHLRSHSQPFELPPLQTIA